MLIFKVQTAVTEELSTAGVTIIQEVEVTSVANNTKGLVVTLNTGGQLDRVEEVLWAVGRKPNTENMGCEEIDMMLDKDGFIEVDEFQNTNIPDVYAVGDVTGKVRTCKNYKFFNSNQQPYSGYVNPRGYLCWTQPS